MNNTRIVVVTDLDHTLSVGDSIPDAHVTTVRQLQGEGVDVIAATGRRHRSAAAMLDAHNLTMTVISVNGALTHNETGQRVARASFDAGVAGDVLAAFVEHGLAPICVIDDPTNPGVDVWTTAPPARWSQWANGDPSIELRDPTSHNWKTGTPHLCVTVAAGDVAAASQVAERLDGLANVTATVDGGGEAFVDANAAGVSKWSAVQALYPNGRPTIIAVGDGGNDIHMLQAADISVVIRDSAAAHQFNADHTIGTVSEHGWAELAAIINHHQR